MKYPTRTKMVRAGTECYPSELGQYNFYYPDKTQKCEFISDAVVEEKNWVGSDNLRAVAVPRGFVSHSCESTNKTSIVWINPEAIEVY